MIMPAYSPTATERVLPRLALDFTTGVLDSRVTVTRALNTATRVNSNGLIEGVNADLPRFDYDPVTFAPKGLLIEETRANLFTQSENFDISPWGGNLITVKDTVISPSGAQTGTTATRHTTGTAESARRITTTQAVSTAYAVSVFVKKNTAGAKLYMRNLAVDGTITTGVVQFDPADGTISLAYGSTYTGKAFMLPYKDGWYRCVVLGTTPASIGANLVDIGVTNGSSAVGGSSTDSVYMYGAQLEAGAFATSYIPTAGSSLTRNADVVQMTGTNFSSWYNQSEGTFVAQAITQRPTTAGSPPRVVTASDGTENNRVAFEFVSTNVRGLVSVSAVNQLLATIAYTPNTTTKFGLAYKLNSFAFAKNGENPTTSTSGTVPSALTALQIGSTSASANFLSGHIQTLYYWPQRLLNAETQAFSKQG